MKPWRHIDMMYLRDNYGRKDIAEIAKALGRTSNSCRQKARGMGLEREVTEKAPTHQRMKELRSAPPTARERAFWTWLVGKGCQIPGCCQPANVHHECFLSQGGNHKSVVALCKFHHQDQKHGRHAMSRERFNETYGIDVLELADKNWLKYINILKGQSRG